MGGKIQGSAVVYFSPARGSRKSAMAIAICCCCCWCKTIFSATEAARVKCMEKSQRKMVLVGWLGEVGEREMGNGRCVGWKGGKSRDEADLQLSNGKADKVFKEPRHRKRADFPFFFFFLSTIVWRWNVISSRPDEKRDGTSSERKRAAYKEQQQRWELELRNGKQFAMCHYWRRNRRKGPWRLCPDRTADSR